MVDREGAYHHVVCDEGHSSLDAVPTSASRVAPVPCHEARQEQQQRRQSASAAGAVGVHERRLPESDGQTSQLGHGGRGDQVAGSVMPHDRTAADCVPRRGARAKRCRKPHRSRRPAWRGRTIRFDAYTAIFFILCILVPSHPLVVGAQFHRDAKSGGRPRSLHLLRGDRPQSDDVLAFKPQGSTIRLC